MSCFCGDTECYSCGPAQGYDPAFETLFKTLYDEFDWPGDEDKMADLIARCLTLGIEEGWRQAEKSMTIGAHEGVRFVDSVLPKTEREQYCWAAGYEGGWKGATSIQIEGGG